MLEIIFYLAFLTSNTKPVPCHPAPMAIYAPVRLPECRESKKHRGSKRKRKRLKV